MSTSKKRKLRKQQERQSRQEILSSLFPPNSDFYQERKIEDEWFIKHWDGSRNKWIIARFSEESYKRYKVGYNKILASKKSFQANLI